MEERKMSKHEREYFLELHPNVKEVTAYKSILGFVFYCEYFLDVSGFIYAGNNLKKDFFLGNFEDVKKINKNIFILIRDEMIRFFDKKNLRVSEWIPSSKFEILENKYCLITNLDGQKKFFNSNFFNFSKWLMFSHFHRWEDKFYLLHNYKVGKNIILNLENLKSSDWIEFYFNNYLGSGIFDLLLREDGIYKRKLLNLNNFKFFNFEKYSLLPWVKEVYDGKFLLVVFGDEYRILRVEDFKIYSLIPGKITSFFYYGDDEYCFEYYNEKEERVKRRILLNLKDFTHKDF